MLFKCKMLSYTGYSNNGNPAYSNGFITGSPSVWIKNCILTCIWEDVCHSGSVQFRHSVVSNSLWPDGLLHVRPPRPSPTPGFTQNHVHWVGDVMQPSHPLLSNSPPTINLSQHQEKTSNESAVRIRWLKHWSFSFSISPPMNTQGSFPLGLTRLISLESNWLSRVFSSTTVWKHQLFGAQPSLWSNSHIDTRLLEKP